MRKSSIVIIIYVLGLLFGAIFLGFWDAETNLIKAMIGLAWTPIFLISLFYAEKKDFE